VETQKPSFQSCPPLYDLTGLQREANGRFGFSAKTTLSIAQALYERHKAITYPRTDSRYLPDDYVPVAKDLMKSLRHGEAGVFAGQALDKGMVRMDKKIFDGSKVSDHFAIIPTAVIPEGLSDAEKKIYLAITQRFIAVFYPRPTRTAHALRNSRGRRICFDRPRVSRSPTRWAFAPGRKASRKIRHSVICTPSRHGTH